MLKSLGQETQHLYFLLLTCFALFGLIFTIAGAALPQIIHTFGWSYTITGLVLAASSGGYFLSSFLNGFLVQRFPPKFIMGIGLALGALSMSLFVRWSSPWLNLLLNFGVGLCQGAIAVVTDLEVIHMEQKGQSRLMNLIHASFCVGAIIGPSAVSYILRARVPLVSVFVASAVLCGILAVLFAFMRFPSLIHGPKQAPRTDHRLLSQPLLLLITAALLVYAGAEIGISSWSSEFAVKVLGVSASTAAFVVALFWLGLLIGRLVISFGYRGVHQEFLMLALSLLSATALVGVLLAQSIAAVVAAVFIAGLGCSGFYPLGMSLLGKHFKTGIAVGTAASGGAAGPIAFPLAMALVAQSFGIRSGFFFYLSANILLVLIAVLLVRLVRRAGQPAA